MVLALTKSHSTEEFHVRLAVPDLISNSYFPAVAAVELGTLRDEGLDVTLELRFPVTDAAGALREGEIDLLAGAAHAPLYDARGWTDTVLLAALAQHMYWFLVVPSHSELEPATWSTLRDLRIGAAPGPDDGLRRLLDLAGIDVEARGIEIAPVPGTDSDSVSFGVTAADALAHGRIDAFWANGMGAEVAVQRGVGKIILDARRGEQEPALTTFPALMTTRRMAEEQPDVAAAAVRALVRAQDALREDPLLATSVAAGLFPDMETGLIAAIIERDLPYYEPAISEAALSGLRDFAEWAGLPGAGTDIDTAVASPAIQP
jgi:ABC-type nitrate/sulfonate/bicarbonate transport system substrate-binding protein